MLLNLLLNSMAAMNGGGRIAIVVHVRHDEPGRQILELSLSDTGSGIPEGEIEKIFKPFFTTKEQGTGLGLPITKRIIEEYGWELQIDSKIGEGTQVTIAMPLNEEKDEKESTATHR